MSLISEFDPEWNIIYIYILRPISIKDDERNENLTVHKYVLLSIYTNTGKYMNVHKYLPFFLQTPVSKR